MRRTKTRLTLAELEYMNDKMKTSFETVDEFIDAYRVAELNTYHNTYCKHLELTAETETETEQTAETDSKTETADSKTTKERATVDFEAIRVNTINAVKSALKSAPTEVALENSADKLVMKATKFTFTATQNDIDKKHRFYIKAEGTKTSVRVQYTKDSFNVVSNSAFLGCTETTQAHPFRATKLSKDNMISAVVSAFYEVVKAEQTAEQTETAEEA